MFQRRAFLTVIEGGKDMRITGQIAATEYARRFGRSTWVDRSIIDELRDGVLEFEPSTEKIYIARVKVITPAGRPS